MDKQYIPQKIETECLQSWQENKLGKITYSGQPYCLMLPPPNVTGSLHMGHGFQITLMDIIARFNRMKGFDVLWQPGTDHAGIATQMVVEKQLLQQNIDKHTLGREKFIDKVWQWKDISGNKIESQIARMGASVDWDRKKFTLDKSMNKAVNQVFIELYKQGLIYKGQRLTNWDCKLQTAVSDLEVTHTTKPGNLWYIAYKIDGSNEKVTIATTRPETMLGDAAIAVNPEDIRFKNLIGKSVIIPLCNRKIPIIADPGVDIDFGTGCLKITPAHDFNDHEIGKKHNLPIHNILNLDGTLNDFVPTKYQGMDRIQARKIIVDDLEESGALVKVEDYTITVPIGDRSLTVLEPLMTSQWFLKMQELAKPAYAAVKNGNIQFVPKNWENTYFKWLEDIQDWCISRQLWWGHRIPAMYDDQGNIYVGESIEAIIQEYNLPKDIKLTQDPDVLDTWFSSALWPFATLGWPDKTIELERYFSTQVLVTGFDIIFFWVARMIMMSLHFTQKVPFEKVYITGLIRDQSGQKMSKSKGNVIDPIDLIEGISLDDLIKKRTANMMQPQLANKIANTTRKHFPDGIMPAGTDALRFTYTALAANGRDINFDMQRLVGYRNFCNKLWNACRYIEMTAADKKIQTTQPKNIINQWIIYEANQLIISVEQHIENFRFDLLAQELYNFTWNSYCDWYLEFSKCLLEDETYFVLIKVMSTILRLLHPIIPFITQNIWQNSNLWRIDNNALDNWPIADRRLTPVKITWLQDIISAIRNIRSELGVAPSKKIQLIINCASKDIKNNAAIIHSMCKISDILWDKNAPINSATATVNSVKIFIPINDLIDVKSELERIEKNIKKLLKNLEPLQLRLSNNQYLTSAPPELVAKTQDQQAELQQQYQALLAKKQQLTAMDKT